MPPGVDLRDCRIYRFYGWDPRTNYTTKTLIYIGETAREPLERMLEHVYEKPWADTITSWEADDQVYAGKDAVLAAERAAVEAERPLYNYEWNRNNSRRVEIWRQEQQRWARDDAKGRPRWVKPTQQYRAPRRVAAASQAPVPVSQPWPAWKQKTALWTGSWLLLNAASAGGVHAYGLAVGWTPLIFASVVQLALVVWSLRGAAITKEQRRAERRRRRARRSG